MAQLKKFHEYLKIEPIPKLVLLKWPILNVIHSLSIFFPRSHLNLLINHK